MKVRRRALVIAATIVGLMASSTGSASASAWDPVGGDPPLNTFQAKSPWPQPHRNGSSQASSPLRGPENNTVTVQKRNFLQDAKVTRSWLGKAIPQTSPFVVLGSKKYTNATSSRALWAVSLTDVYKYEVNGNAAPRFIDNEQMNRNGFSVPWNMQLLNDPATGNAPPHRNDANDHGLRLQ